MNSAAEYKYNSYYLQLYDLLFQAKISHYQSRILDTDSIVCES